MFRRLALLVFVLAATCFPALPGTSAQSTGTIEIQIFHNRDSLILSLEGNASISPITDLVYEVWFDNGWQRYWLSNYFTGVRFDQLSAPICFSLLRQGEGILPAYQGCTGLIYQQTLPDAQAFWYDFSAQQIRNLNLFKGTTFVWACPAGQSQGCTINYPLPDVVLPSDADSDGVQDGVDLCPAQGDQGHGVDANGCPIIPPPTPDTDGDGVFDSTDRCPAQGSQGYGVDADGCPLAPPKPLDTDGDNVPDVMDGCPTQGDQGYGLDVRGCPLQPPDSDGDGVLDSSDACPAQGDLGYGLDVTGCPVQPPLDSDGDGVLERSGCVPRSG